MTHPSRDVEIAIVRLCDALCAWERGTGIESVLVIRERGFIFRAQSGKPISDSMSDIPDETIFGLLS